MKVLRLLLTVAVCLVVWTAPTAARQGEDDFAKAVSPLLTEPASMPQRPSGFRRTEHHRADHGNLLSARDEWEKILRRVRASDAAMGVARPSDAVVRAFTGDSAELDRADAAIRPDLGRVTARRLNRSEYSNTIRFARCRFSCGEAFPTDDSGDGFDNIGEI
jgi:hypothetical protein